MAALEARESLGQPRDRDRDGPRDVPSLVFGVYRLWRDLGFAIGALAAGVIADAFGMPPAIVAVAALTATSGLVVLVRMRETVVRT